MAVVPYKEQDASKKEQVAQMFDTISPRYDFLNHLLSGGIDILWRKKAIRMLRPERPQTILDIATGTGDFALEALALRPEKIVGVDISEGMLAYGREKIKRLKFDSIIELRYGDSENLPFESNSFDAVIVSFGVRNFENLERGLSEIYRVLRPGGTAVVLEFSQPKGWFRPIYQFYFKYITPTIGGFFSKDRAAYAYLPESVQAFPSGAAFLRVYEQAGFSDTKCIPLTFGVSSIYWGKK
jgi:demethylmenaquinone methyltransferase/2-methoxy-6-polyprenyl-1,4-benzoquinol methylase